MCVCVQTGLYDHEISACVCVCLCVRIPQLRERVCVCTLSIKHDCTFTIAQGVLCVVCVQTSLPATVHYIIALEEVVWLLCFGSGMHVHLSSLRVCVRVLACTFRWFIFRRKITCVCVLMCLSSNIINMIGKRVLDHILACVLLKARTEETSCASVC
jgi:hypothetical protein